MNISEKIFDLRKKSGLSQEALAEKLGVSRQSVSKWESGGAIPDIDKVIAMSALFGVSTDFILIDDQPAAPNESKPETTNDSALEPAKADPAFITPPSPQLKKKTKKRLAQKIIAIAACICIVVTAICVPLHFGGVRAAIWEISGGKVQYPYVLVHGLGGWGEGNGINEVAEYWGASTGDLSAFLQEQGYKVYEPSVGPFSSTWDRVCELYAQLTGTTVDYGEAHSKEHNHERFGRAYTQPLFEGWGKAQNARQKLKINLVGHSFGGATSRMLASLMEYGNEAEMQATGDLTSPLFTGGKGDWINSVTALCAPHNGSSLTTIIESIGGLAGIENPIELIISACFSLAGLSTPISGIYDFRLDQFGLGKIDGGYNEIVKSVSSVLSPGIDHAGYDLSPDGAAQVNEKIEMVDDVYYFSYAYCTTKQAKLLGVQVPQSSTLAILYPMALAMGAYTGTTANGIEIDQSWQPNDGLVSVVSASYPSDEPHVDFVGEVQDAQKGIWNFMGTYEGDHGTVIGLNADTQKTHDFYMTLFSSIDSLKR